MDRQECLSYTERRPRSSDAKLHSNGVKMTREEALQFKQRWQFVNDFIAAEIRMTKPEVRFQQLRTMIATAHRLRQPDAARDAAAAAVRERWRLLKERVHASS